MDGLIALLGLKDCGFRYMVEVSLQILLFGGACFWFCFLMV